ncbi:PLAC8 family-domain-containing protein [Lasiosphaeris hirsuta]|uniref:PLAC8 family-domain-containing protein n=1 Tax=Lasiosphaeris hirsuta TaxID=260670 RepID=A0AA40E2K1_9PEZI|nr:PLAC8 family-domain-containing protein [Lasiosphaeris hirsuta]
MAPQTSTKTTAAAAAAGSWQTSFWKFAPGSSFINSIFCPCILYGQTNDRLHASDKVDAKDKDKQSNGCVPFAIFQIAVPNGGFYHLMQQRREIRARYNIAGNAAVDCLASFFCMCCVQVQADEEVKLREAAAAAANKAGPVSEGYKASEAMSVTTTATATEGEAKKEETKEVKKPEDKKEETKEVKKPEEKEEVKKEAEKEEAEEKEKAEEKK